MNKVQGNLYNFISMLSYAFYPAFISVLGFVDKSGSTQEKIAIGFGIVAGKELFTFLLYLLLNIKNMNYLSIYKSLKTKNGLKTIFAGMLGGPVGFSALTVGALIVGASSPDAMTLTMAILVTVAMSKIFLKNKNDKVVNVGIAITLVGAILLLWLQGDIEAWDSSFWLGITFAMIAALAWGLEAFMMGQIMKNSKLDENTVLGIKLSSSSVIGIFLAIIVSLISTKDMTSMKVFSKFFIDWSLFLKMIVVAVSMISARYFFFKGIKNTSATVASTIVTLQIIFIPIFIVIFSLFSLNIHESDKHLIANYKFWLISLILIMGSILASSTDKQIKQIFIKKNKTNSI